MTEKNHQIQTKIKSLKQDIIDAFSGAPVPRPHEIVNPKYRSEIIHRDAKKQIVAQRNKEQAAQLRLELCGRPWDSLDVEYLKQKWSSFVYLSAEAHRYYLTALLVRSLETFQQSTDFLHSVVFHLIPDFLSIYSEGHDSDHEYVQSLLQPQEYQAVCAFLGFVFDFNFDLKKHGLHYRFLAAKALKWGWNRFENESLKRSLAFYETMYNFPGYPNNLDAERIRLVEEIFAAFKDTPYPGDKELIQNPAHCDEEAELALEFRGRDWKRLDPEFLGYHETVLSFFSPAGFQYILPAYLILDLYGLSKSSTPVFSLTSNLQRPGVSNQANDEMEKHMIEKLALFMKPERLAIINYLKSVARENEFERDSINSALENYWVKMI